MLTIRFKDGTIKFGEKQGQPYKRVNNYFLNEKTPDKNGNPVFKNFETYTDKEGKLKVKGARAVVRGNYLYVSEYKGDGVKDPVSDKITVENAVFTEQPLSLKLSNFVEGAKNNLDVKNLETGQATISGTKKNEVISLFEQSINSAPAVQPEQPSNDEAVEAIKTEVNEPTNPSAPASPSEPPSPGM